MTGREGPELLVLDDREGLVRRAAGGDRLRTLCRVEFLDTPLGETDRDLSEVRMLVLIRLDVDPVSRRGIPLALTRHATAVSRSIPELTFLLASACLRRLPESQQVVDSGRWDVPVGRMLSGRTLGILGLGRHGRNVARLGAALGMGVLPGPGTGRWGRRRWTS